VTDKPQTGGATAPAKRSYFRAIGPGLITAAVVIGPGSILTSSKVGAAYGFQLIWVLVVAVVFMMVFTTLGAKLGVVSGRSAGDLITKLAGRWLAAVIGIGVFFISASFQFGNNLGVHSAFEAYFEGFEYVDYVVILFNALAIAFMFAFKDLYRVVERLMATFVGMMLLSFVINLLFAKPSVTEMAAGLVPRIPKGTGGSEGYIAVLGMIGTTFVISAAFYQSYLVRQKGWGKAELRNGLIDARVASVILGLITLMIMSTSGAVLRGSELQSVADVARQLEPLFGQWGKALFCTGLFCAAYSSFIVNSMIGGFMMSDGLGLGSRPTDLWPRIFSAVVLLTGMGVALCIIKADWDPVPAIVFAQAVTVVAAPLMAGAILWLTNRKDIMGRDRNGLLANIVGGLGFVMLCAIAVNLAANKVWPEISNWLAGG
jgi:NRAMP (natural resistance-associated macrophage protein)-like metal ion transporter